METPRYSKLAALVIASLSATAALAAPQGKAVAVIDMADYGMMRGAAVLDKALALLEH